MYLTKATEADFCAVYEDMQTQFPYVQIKAKETFLTLCRQTDYHVWLAKEDAGGQSRNVGYMLVWLDAASRSAWLEYIAVFKPYHGKGLGSKMLRLLRLKYPDIKGCFLELEKPRPKDADSHRRVAFYTKKGAFALNFRYFYPQRGGALELDLYFLPFQNGLRALPDGAVLGSIKNAYRTLHAKVPHARDVLRRIGPLARV